MPQLNPEFFISQLFWLAVLFSFLFIFLWRISLPRISKVLENRQTKIDESLSSAKNLQEKAQKIEQRINEQINKAKQENDESIKQTITSLQNNVSEKLATLDKELNEKIETSEKTILKNRNDQLDNINEEINKITKITLSKIVNIEVSNDEVNNAIKNYKELLN